MHTPTHSLLWLVSHLWSTSLLVYHFVIFFLLTRRDLDQADDLPVHCFVVHIRQLFDEVELFVVFHVKSNAVSLKAFSRMRLLFWSAWYHVSMSRYMNPPQCFCRCSSFSFCVIGVMHMIASIRFLRRGCGRKLHFQGRCPIRCQPTRRGRQVLLAHRRR